jgi:uncharacterized membrane protein
MAGRGHRSRVQRARQRARVARHRLERSDPLWPAQVTVLVAILLGLLLPSQLTIGPSWALPALEAALLAGLIVATPRSPEAEGPRYRRPRIALISVVSAANVVSLFLLADGLVEGRRHDGRALLVGGAILWVTLVLLFAVWFWEIDRGGPVRRLHGFDDDPHFLFPQEELGDQQWRATLADYLYVSLANSTSFGPGDAMPMTHLSKLLMGLQSLASLMTLAVVLAYAINNLQ